MDRWKIIYYETAQGQSPIFDFIQNLDIRIRNKIADVLDLLAEYGIQIGSHHAKKLAGTPLWELRILGESSIRLFYVAIVGKQFLLLHGIIKKTQKTPTKEIKTALARLKEYQSRIMSLQI